MSGIQIVTEEEAEKCDFLVCVPKSRPAIFDDDEFGVCCECCTEVRFRPNAPKAPPRLCFECFLKRKMN